MYYDKVYNIAPSAISTHLRIDIADLEDISIGIGGSFLQNLPSPVEYDLAKSYIKVIIKDSLGKIIYDRLGYFVYDEEIGGYINTIVFGEPIPISISAVQNINVKGRIYLTNNTFFEYNKVNLGPETFINLYFNN